MTMVFINSMTMGDAKVSMARNRHHGIAKGQNKRAVVGMGVAVFRARLSLLTSHI